MVNTPVRMERELRKRLDAHRTYLNSRWVELFGEEVDALTEALAPWIVELVEEADTRARMATEGRLPKSPPPLRSDLRHHILPCADMNTPETEIRHWSTPPAR